MMHRAGPPSSSIFLSNIWSSYSLLASLWDIVGGMDLLAQYGYRHVGLADWQTIAGAELFDQAARQRGLIPWLGVTTLATIGPAEMVVRIYAASPAGWQQLSRRVGSGQIFSLEEWADTSLWLILPAESRGLWSQQIVSILSLPFQHIIEGVAPGSAALGNIPWLPDPALRFYQEEDRDAYYVLTQIGQMPADPAAQGICSPQKVAQSVQGPLSLRFNPPEDGVEVLPKKIHRMPQYAATTVQEKSWLAQQAYEGLKRLGKDGHREYRGRLDYELQVIGELGFSGYFLILEDLVAYARQQGICTGPGRGSAAGSLVAYALGITAVDPLRYGLLFERFLNPARQSLPDIDLDVDFQRRGELIAYLRQRWGSDHVAQIGAFGTLGRRAVLRDVGRVEKVPLERVTAAVRALERAEGDWETALAQAPAADQSWMKVARRLEGLPRHRSVHAAGVVISPDPVTQWMACERDDSGHLITQMEMGSVERLGFLKMDVLGLRTLTVLDGTMRTVQGGAWHWAQIPEQDDETDRLLARSDTDGVFQLDSAGVRHLLRKMRPRGQKDLMTVLALYRPGPMEMIATYLHRRRHPQDVPDDPLARLCADTAGVMVYQEQL
ncbi:MAG: DNA polymerase III subunit alpha, partial [Firmicutes bacterium]|nr:DNA polymerase III subunit alpha [Bacillota bacterium]